MRHITNVSPLKDVQDSTPRIVPTHSEFSINANEQIDRVQVTCSTVCCVHSFIPTFCKYYGIVMVSLLEDIIINFYKFQVGKTKVSYEEKGQCYKVCTWMI